MNRITPTPEYRPLSWLIAGWLLFSLVTLGAAPLFDYDETIYAQTALDMMNNGEWIVPIANGMQFFEKPPFTYYLMDISFVFFGDNSFAARLPSLIFTLLTALIIFRFGSRIYSRTFGMAAAAIYLSMLEVGLLAHAAILDPALNFFIASALLNYFLWLQKHDRRHAFWCATMMGAAVSIKGPVGVVIPLLVILLDRLRAGELAAALRRIPWVPALALFFATATPWYLMIALTHGPQFLYEFIWVHNIGRAMQPMQGHGGGWHYYLVVFAVSVLPWLAWWGWSAAVAWRERHAREPLTDIAVLALIWMGVVLVLFTIARTKLPHYISSIYPGVALLLAAMLFRHSPEKAIRRRIRLATAMLLLPIAAALAIFPLLYPQLTELVHNPRAAAVVAQDIAPSPWLALAGLLLLAGIVALFRVGSGAPERVALRYALLGLLLQVSLLGGLGSFAGTLVQAPQLRIAEALKSLPPAVPIYSYMLNMPSISFYAGRNYEILVGLDAAARLATAEKPYAVILRSEAREQLPMLGQFDPAVDQGGYLLYLVGAGNIRRP